MHSEFAVRLFQSLHFHLLYDENTIDSFSKQFEPENSAKGKSQVNWYTYAFQGEQGTSIDRISKEESNRRDLSHAIFCHQDAIEVRYYKNDILHTAAKDSLSQIIVCKVIKN